jgi:hypothetical protein
MKTKINIAMIMFLCVSIAQADPPILVDPRTGKYLGNLSSNQFDPNSVNNQFATSVPVIIHRYDNSSFRAGIYRNSIDELNGNLAEHNRGLSERNRIIENELFQARQERQLARNHEYLRDFYERERTDWSKYVQLDNRSRKERVEDWEWLKKQFPAKTSAADETKLTEEAKAIREDHKKRNPDAFKSQETLPDLSKAPKWADAKPEFAKFSKEERVKVKQAYFNHYIRPHVGSQADALLQQFLSMKP